MTTLQLHVHVVEACNIPRTDFLTPPDLYMTLQLSTSAAVQCTSVFEQSQSPIWNQQFHFTIHDPSYAVLVGTVKSRSLIGGDVSLAKLEIALNQLVPYNVADTWVNLEVLTGQGANPMVRLILQVAPDRHPAFQPLPEAAPPRPAAPRLPAAPPGATAGPPPRGYAAPGSSGPPPAPAAPPRTPAGESRGRNRSPRSGLH
jgi:hypothetical protein